MKGPILRKCLAQMSKRSVVRLKRLSSKEIETHTRCHNRFQNNHSSYSYQNQEVRFDKHTHLTASKSFKLNQDYKKRKYHAMSHKEKARKYFETNPNSLQSENNNAEVINTPSRPMDDECKKTKNVKSSSCKTNSSFPYSSPNDHHVSSDVRSQPMNVSYNSSSPDLPTGASVSSVNLVSKSSNARYCDKSPTDRQPESGEKKYFLQRLEVYYKNSGDHRFLYKQKKLSNTVEKQKFGGKKNGRSVLDGNTTKIKPAEGTDSDPLLPSHLGTVGSIRKHNQSRNNLTDLDESFSSIDHTQANKDKTEKISSSQSLNICKTSISFNNNDLKHSNLTSCKGSNPHKNDEANKIITCSQNKERQSFVSPFQKEFAKHTMAKEATQIHTKSSVKKTHTTTTDSHFTSFIYGKKNVTDRFNSVVARKRNYASEKSDENAGHHAKKLGQGGTNITTDSPEALVTNSNNLPQNNNPIKVKQQINDNEKGNVSEENVLSNQTPKPLSKAQNDPLNISQDKKCKKIRNKKSKSLEEKFCLLFGEDEDYYINKENTLGNNRTTTQGDSSKINVGSTPKDIDDNINKTLKDEVDPLSIETSSCPTTEAIKMLNSEGALDITSLGLDTLDKLFPSMVANKHNQENNIKVLAGSETEKTTQAVGKIQSSLQDIVMTVIDSTDLGATKVIEIGADNSVSENHTHNRNISENGVPNTRLNENVQPKDTPIQNGHTNYNLIQINAGRAVENTTKVIGSNAKNNGINNEGHKLALDINVGSDKHQTQEMECDTNEESSNAQQELHISIINKVVQQSLVESDSRDPKYTNPIKIHTSPGVHLINLENTSPINTHDSEHDDSTALANTNGASHEKGEAAVNCGSDTAPNKSHSDRIRVRTTQFLMAKEHQLTELQLMGSPNLLWTQSLNSSDQSPSNSTAGPAPESGSSGTPSLLGPTQPMTVSNYSSNETRPLNKSLETNSAGGVTTQDRSLAFANENVDITTILDSIKLLQLSELIYTIILEMRRFICRKLEAKRLSSIVAQTEASAAQSSFYDSLLSKHKFFLRLLGNHFNCFRNYYFSKYVHNNIALHFPESKILHNEVLKCFDIIIGTHQQIVSHYMVQRGKEGLSNSSQIQGDKTNQPSVVASQQHSAQQAYSAPAPQYNNSQTNYSASWDNNAPVTPSTARGNFSDNNLGSTYLNNSLPPQSNNDPIINQTGALPSYENHSSFRQSLQNQQNLVPTNINVDSPTNVFANNIYNQHAPNVNPFQDSSHRNNSQDSSSINLHSLLQQNSCFETPKQSLAPPRLNNYYHHSNNINVQQPRSGGPPNVSPIGNSNQNGSGGQLHYRTATTSFQTCSPTVQENQNYLHQTPKEPPAATHVKTSLQTTKTNFTCTNTNSSATKPSKSKVLNPPKKVGETKRKSLLKKGSTTNVPRPVGPAACPAPQMSNQPPTNAEPGFLNAHQAQPMHYNTSSVNNNYARDNQYLGQQTLHQNQSYQQNSVSNIASGYLDSTNAAQGNVSKRSEQFNGNRYSSTSAAPYADGNLSPYRQQARPNESISLEHSSFPHSSTTQQYTAPQYYSYHPQTSPGNLRQTVVHYAAQPSVGQNMGSPMSQHNLSRQYPGQQQNPSRPSVNPVAQYSATYPQSTVNSQYTSPAVNTNSHSMPVQPANIAQPGAPTLTNPPLAASKTQVYISEGSLPNQDIIDSNLGLKGVQSRTVQMLQCKKNNNLPMYDQESLQQNSQTSLGQADINRGGGPAHYSGQKTPVVDTSQTKNSYQRLFEENVKNKLGFNPSIFGPSKNQKDKVACQNILQTQLKSAKIADSTLLHNTQQVATSSGNSALNMFALEPTPPKHHASAINQHNHPQNQHNPPYNGNTTPLNHHALPPNGHTTPPNQHSPAPNGHTTPHNRHATPPNQHSPAPNGHTTPHNRHATPPNQHNPAPNGHTTPHNRHATPPNQHSPAPNQLVTLPGQYSPALNKLYSLAYQNPSPQQIGEMPRRSSISQSRLQKLLTSPSMSVLDKRLSTEPPRSNDVTMIYEDPQEPRTLSRDSGYKTPSPMEALQTKEPQNDAATTDNNDNDSWLIKLKEPTNCLLCDRQAAEACSSCRKAFYCSKACQVKHWEESHYAECVLEHVSKNLD